MTAPAMDLAREADFRVGPLLVRPSRREAGEGAARQLLEPRVMQVLVALARQPDEVVSRSTDVFNRKTGQVLLRSFFGIRSRIVWRHSKREAGSKCAHCLQQWSGVPHLGQFPLKSVP